MRIEIFSVSAIAPWDGCVMNLSRVPNIGENVRLNSYGSREVVDVTHLEPDPDDSLAAVAIIVLKDGL